MKSLKRQKKSVKAKDLPTRFLSHDPNFAMTILWLCFILVLVLYVGISGKILDVRKINELRDDLHNHITGFFP